MLRHIFSTSYFTGVELPRVPGLKAEVVKTHGTTVKLSWDQPKDLRKEKWVFGVYYGLGMKELFQSKSSFWFIFLQSMQVHTMKQSTVLFYKH